MPTDDTGEKRPIKDRRRAEAAKPLGQALNDLNAALDGVGGAFLPGGVAQALAELSEFAEAVEDDVRKLRQRVAVLEAKP